MNRDFETELREDLAAIKTKQQSNSESLGVFLEKTQTQEVELKTTMGAAEQTEVVKHSTKTESRSKRK